MGLFSAQNANLFALIFAVSITKLREVLCENNLANLAKTLLPLRSKKFKSKNENEN
jgi:hypothetical protein